MSLDPTRPALLLIDVQPRRTRSTNELPALAFGSHYSVFKERPGTHQYCRCWCRVLRRTVPDGLLRWKVSFGCRRALGGRSDGMVTVTAARSSVNAARKEFLPGAAQAAAQCTRHSSGPRVGRCGWPPGLAGPRTGGHTPSARHQGHPFRPTPTPSSRPPSSRPPPRRARPGSDLRRPGPTGPAWPWPRGSARRGWPAR